VQPSYRRVYDSRHLQAAKNRDQLRNPTLGNRVWATFTFLLTLCPHIMRSRVYVIVGICRSICTLLLWVCCCGPGGQEILIGCCMAVSQQQPCSSKCGQCHINGRRRRLNADLFEMHLLSRACKGMTVRHMLQSMQETKDRKVWESLRYSQEKTSVSTVCINADWQTSCEQISFSNGLGLITTTIIANVICASRFLFKPSFQQLFPLFSVHRIQSHCGLCILYLSTNVYIHVHQQFNQSINQ